MTEPQSLGVGEALAQARKTLGLSHQEVAVQIKFMPRQLEALEAERFQALPGPTIARGMVRTYARFLKLDPEPLLARLNGRVDAPDATPQLAARFNQPVPFSDGGRRSTAVYLALSAIVLAVAGALLYEWRHERPPAAFVAPAKQAEPLTRTASIATPPVAAQPPAEPQQVAEPARAAPPLEPAGALPKAVGGSNRLELRFDREAWLEVVDGAGRLLVSSLQPGGTERVVRCLPPCNVVVGNAQHVKVMYNEREFDLQPHVKVEVARFTLK